MKLAEIQAKQREIKAFLEETRRVLSEYQAELRRLPASLTDPPGAFAARERRELEWRAAEVEKRRAARDAAGSANSTPATQGTLILQP